MTQEEELAYEKYRKEQKRNVTRTQFRILRALKETDTPAVVAEKLGISATTVELDLGSLLKKNLARLNENGDGWRTDEVLP